MENSFRVKIQQFGRFLSGMVMPNIGAFIAWGLITAFFIPTGWVPNETLSSLVGPMIIYMLPLLIGFTGGKMIYGTRGGVLGVIATMGVIVGADIPMFIGAMVMGPLGGYAIKQIDRLLKDKIPTGFEMLVNNFTAGIAGMLLSMLALLIIGPVVLGLNAALEAGVDVIVKANLLPIASIFIEPAKILFLNNAINHGVLGPLGIAEAADTGKSIFFMLETNPGPGLGILAAFWAFGKGMSKQSAPGSIIIHFFGGIHEIYFPYVLMKPVLVLGAIAGGATGVFIFQITGVGLVATPSPGSIFAYLAMTPRGNFFGVLLGILASTVVSFIVTAYFLKRDKTLTGGDLETAKEKMTDLKGAKKVSNVTKIAFACDAGMGSSAMGASTLRNKLKKAGVSIEVVHSSLEDIPNDVDLVVTHKDLKSRAQKYAPQAEIIAITNFVGAPEYDTLVNRLK
ncbi:MAG: PTS mannitol transporter subunit IICB [Candidatus Izemoplasmataceae bacterium]